MQSSLLSNPRTIRVIPTQNNNNNSDYEKNIINNNGSFLIRQKYYPNIKYIEVIDNSGVVVVSKEIKI